MEETFNDKGFGQAFRGEGSTPEYGFSSQYEPSPQARIFGRIMELMSDPRNSWIGMGSVGKFGKLLQMAKDGGFRMPTSAMRMKDPYLTKGLDEAATRKDYLTHRRIENTLAENKLSGSPIEKRVAQDYYNESTTHTQSNIDKTMEGRKAVQTEMKYPYEN